MRFRPITTCFTVLFLMVFPVFSQAQNVGIGTTDPDARLHVAGAIQTDSTLIVKPYSTTAADTISIGNNVGLLIINIDSASQTNSISLSGTPKAGQMLQIINLDNESATFGGFTIQDNSSASFVYNGTSWSGIHDTRVLSDFDGDTRVEVESNPDEDLINLIIPYGSNPQTWTFSSTNLITPLRHRISIGHDAGYSLTGDESNTITIGNSAGYNLTDETSSVIAIGSSALQTGGEIEHSVAVGSSALGRSTGNNNTAVGSQAGRGATGFSGGLNSFYGASSGLNALGSSNVMVGSYTGYNASGSNSVLLGSRAGFNATGSNNIMLGYHAGYNETGSNKLYIANSDTSSPLIYGAFDSSLLRVNGTLDINNAYQFPTVDGDSGQVLITDGAGSVSWVDNSGGPSDFISDADADTKIQVEANTDEDKIRFVLGGTERWHMAEGRLVPNSSNIMIGLDAGESVTSGTNNTILGYYSGNSLTTGSNNIFLGNQAGFNETGSNKLYIANSDTANPLIYGEFDNNLLRINGSLDINNAYQLPTVDGDSGQVLITDGAGVVSWVDKSNGAIDSLSDADGDTKIKVEATTDEDKIRFSFPVHGDWVMHPIRIETPLSMVIFGRNAGGNLDSDAVNTVVIGSNAAYNGSGQAVQNVVVGSSALYEAGETEHNTAIGATSLYRTTGTYNTALGSGAGYGDTIYNGSANVFLGASAGRKARGSYNVLVGQGAGYNNKGSSNVFLGNRAGYNESGSNKLYIENSNSSNPLIYGEFDNDLVRVNGTLDINNAYQLPTVDGNSGQVLYTNGTGTIGWTTPFVGFLDSITDADGDTKILLEKNADEDKIRFNIAGSEKWIMVGNRIEPSSDNTVIGQNAGDSITSGQGLTAFGANALKSNTTANNNTAFGLNALQAATTGQFNGAFGAYAGYSLQSGSHNVFVGNSAGYSNENGSQNTFIGQYAGYGNLGSGNVFIGRYAGGNETSSNKLYIANTNTSSPLIYGEFDNAELQFNGDVLPGATATYTLGSSTNRWKVIYANNGTIQTSDRRLKTNISNVSYGLEEVMQIRSVSYNWKQDSLGKTKLGFIAQELEQVIPEVVHMAEDSLGTRGVNYAELVPVLVRAIQEQQQIIEAQQSVEVSQNERLQALEARLIYLEHHTSSK